MKVIETLKDGLKRAIKIIIPAKDLISKRDEKLESLQSKVELKGFRAGKVPLSHLRRMYSKSVMAEIINELLSEIPNSVLKERNEKAALQPKLDMSEDQQQLDKIVQGEADLEFSLTYEILPVVELKPIDNIAVERFIVEVSDEEVDSQLERLQNSARTYKTKKGKAVKGDRVLIDYVGKIDGEPFDNGSDKGTHLVLGSKQFIPGFEEQLIGAKAGDEIAVSVTFPENYAADHLAGKEAVFDVTVHEVAAAEDISPDEIAKKLGMDSFEQLKERVKAQIENQYGAVTRQKLKSQIFDHLAKDYDFAVPENLVTAEFEGIWNQLTSELKAHAKTFADEGTTEEEAKKEYKDLAERRVRLGLIIAAFGEDAKLTVTEQDLQAALFTELRRYPGQEKQMFEFFQKNPEAMANLRAPVIEEKVIDHFLGKIKITDKKVSSTELMEEDETPKKATKKAKTAKETAPAKKAKKKSKDLEEKKES